MKPLILSIALLASGAPAFGQVSAFANNEVRAESMKNYLRRIQAAFTEGSESMARHTAAVVEAFQDSEDWPEAVDAYHLLEADLVKRAAALDAELDAAIARNSPENEPHVAKELSAL
ncbi:MAG: hypothetical protein HYZ74_04500, partial [Elusimicrobia bacterium]|nr:hypothetical protein [Elusimicrobiota bacterium]